MYKLVSLSKEVIFYEVIYNLINKLLLYNDAKLVEPILALFLLESLLVYCHWNY